jgi:hypothetical protein
VDGARRILILLIAAAAVPAVAQNFSFVQRDACFSDGTTAYRVSSANTRADRVVKIEAEAAAAALRIAITDDATSADFVLVDDNDSAASCRTYSQTPVKTIALDASAAEPDVTVGLMSAPEAADYRIYVRSEHFSRDAAVALFAAMHAATAKVARP